MRSRDVRVTPAPRSPRAAPLRALAPLAAAAALCAFGPSARADECGRPDLLETMPPDGATDVPTDARLQARYAATAEYLGEEVVLEHVGVDERAVDPIFDVNEGLLVVSPPEALVPGDEYVIRWPRLRGLGTATLGRSADVRFVAGALADATAPEFAGLSSVEWDLDRSRDECTDSLQARYVFDLGLSPASDDGGRGSLTLVVFQTRGPGITAPEPFAVRRFPAPGKPLRVERTERDAIGEVCFAAVARDLVGRTSASGSVERCTRTVRPPFFEGCSAAPRGPRPGALVSLVLAGVAALSVGRRRSRAAR
ncbi:MAG: hypothetical protein IT376_02480 [Polyangiaceae bacterium]|nr:hypothetical protein [Polyangiaceae bacterium]